MCRRVANSFTLKDALYDLCRYCIMFKTNTRLASAVRMKKNLDNILILSLLYITVISYNYLAVNLVSCLKIINRSCLKNCTSKKFFSNSEVKTNIKQLRDAKMHKIGFLY